MTEKEQNTYPKWIHRGLIEREASNHKKDVARGITDENEPFSLREVGNALNETVDIFIELQQEKEQLREENEELKQENKALKERIKNYPICYTCKYCFRDDWYGVCCENEDCPHYTRYWELELQTECEYYELKEEEDEDDY